MYSSLQVKFGLSYILIIAAVLLLLNTYPLRVSQDLVFRSKEATLESSVSVMVYSLSGLDHLTEENVAQAMAVVEETGMSRILVTDETGRVLYDTRETGSAVGEYAFYTEIVQALLGSDVFTSTYQNGAFRSRASSPVLYQSQVIGAVYAYEYDTEQAALLEGLQANLLRLSAMIGVAVLVLSVVLSRVLTRKIGQLLTAIRQVREGAYSHRAEIAGHDEIAQIEQELSQTVSKKKEALNAFETVTKNIIADEIHAGTQEKIAQQAVKCRDEERELLELQGALKKKNLFITDHYGAYLSREFLEPDKLDALAGIMTNGTAANLSEAMQAYKKMNNA